MLYFGIPRHTQSMIAYNIISGNFSVGMLLLLTCSIRSMSTCTIQIQAWSLITLYSVPSPRCFLERLYHQWIMAVSYWHEWVETTTRLSHTSRWPCHGYCIQQVCECVFRKRELFACNINDDRGKIISFELRLCTLQNENIYGIYFGDLA